MSVWNLQKAMEDRVQSVFYDCHSFKSFEAICARFRSKLKSWTRKLKKKKNTVVRIAMLDHVLLNSSVSQRLFTSTCCGVWYEILSDNCPIAVSRITFAWHGKYPDVFFYKNHGYQKVFFPKWIFPMFLSVLRDVEIWVASRITEFLFHSS